MMKLVTRKHKKLKGVIPPYMYMSNPTKFKILDRDLVDGEPWVTVQIHPDIRPWMHTQPEKMWYQHIDHNWYTVANTFDMHEKIYTMMAVRWS